MSKVRAVPAEYGSDAVDRVPEADHRVLDAAVDGREAVDRRPDAIERVPNAWEHGPNGLK
jgi:hypothetical protein